MEENKKKVLSKRIIYGSFSTFMVLAAVALFFLINLIASRFNATFDLTQDQSFTLNRQTLEVISNLDREISIYSLFPSGSSTNVLIFRYEQLLREYANASPLITYTNVDPLLRPGFVEQFASDTPVSAGSLIITGANRHRIIPSSDLETREFNWQQGTNVITAFNIQPLVTNAINYIMQDYTPLITRVVGSGEFNLPSDLLSEINSAGYDFREVDLLTNDIPEETAILLITMPERDWTPDIAEKIRAYLENDGRAALLLGFVGQRFTNMNSVLAAFGLSLGEYIVIEADDAHMLSANPLWILPVVLPHEITDPIISGRLRPFFMSDTSLMTTGIDILELRRTSTRYSPILTTSHRAFGRSDFSVEGVTQTSSDIPGPITLALAVEDNFFVGGTTLTTRLAVFSSESIMISQVNSTTSGANWNLIIRSFDWLREAEDRVWVPAQRPPASTPLGHTFLQARLIAAFAAIILPLAIAITGIVVWLRRKNA